MTSDAPTLPTVDTARPEVWAEPETVLGPLLRQGTRAVRTTTPEGTMLLGADLVHRALADARMGAPSAELLERTGWAPGPYVDWFRSATVHMDPPDHTRLRALVSRAFTPRSVARFRDTATRVAHDLCDEVTPGEDFDLTGRFARLLPLRVICELLGIEDVDAERVGRWSSTLGEAMSASSTSMQEIADQATTDFAAYVDEVVAHRRAHPGEDLLTTLIQAEEAGDRLSQRELIMLTIQLVFAGHETTQTLLSTGVWRLLSHPDQLAALRAEPDLAEGAVDELLRLDPPAVVVARIPREDLDLDGVPLRQGDYVTLSLFSANRDPARHDRPDELDIRRTVDRQFAFGFGAHHCVGNHLARIEAAVGLQVLLARFGRIEEVGTSRWVADTLRGRRDVTVRAWP